MAALLLRRASFLFPLATCSPGSSSLVPLAGSSSSIRHRVSASRCLPLSTSCSRPGNSHESPLFAFGTSDNFSVPDGVPFDSVEKDPEGRYVTLTRKTKDEIIEIQVEVPKKHNTDHVPNLSLEVKILYGNNFNRCFTANCQASPDNRLCICRISIRPEEKSGGRSHLEEFEDFFKERGVEPCNLNFLVDYISKRNAIKHD